MERWIQRDGVRIGMTLADDEVEIGGLTMEGGINGNNTT